MLQNKFLLFFKVFLNKIFLMQLLQKSPILIIIFLFIIGCRDAEIVPTDPKIINPPIEVLQQPYESPYFLSSSQKYIYDAEAVPDISLEITKEEWNKILSYYDQNSQNEE